MYKAGFLEALKYNISDFKNKVFIDGGLQDFIDSSKCRGHSAEFGDYKILTYELACGEYSKIREMLQFVTDNFDISKMKEDRKISVC